MASFAGPIHSQASLRWACLNDNRLPPINTDCAKAVWPRCVYCGSKPVTQHNALLLRSRIHSKKKHLRFRSHKRPHQREGGWHSAPFWCHLPFNIPSSHTFTYTHPSLSQAQSVRKKIRVLFLVSHYSSCFNRLRGMRSLKRWILWTSIISHNAFEEWCVCICVCVGGWVCPFVNVHRLLNTLTLRCTWNEATSQGQMQPF